MCGRHGYSGPRLTSIRRHLRGLEDEAGARLPAQLQRVAGEIGCLPTPNSTMTHLAYWNMLIMPTKKWIAPRFLTYV